MMDRSGESTYEYDGLGRITKVTIGSGEVTSYQYDGSDQLESITYPDGKKVSYKYDKNDNLTEVTDRTGAKTTYVYDAINRIMEIHRPNGVSTYNTYNARDQIVSMKNICEDCDWVVSQYDYTYDDRGFITGEDAIESPYGYAWDDKHDGKHENWHDTLYPHGDKHYNKHDKDGLYGFQIIETKRAFEYDDDGKLLSATENEDRQGRYDYTFRYDDMGNRTFYAKSRNGKVQESAEYTYNSANQPIKAREYDGKHYKNVEYSYDADGNRILEEEVKPDGTRKVEKSYEYTVENRLKAVSDKNDLLAAMAYDGDGNRIFQLNYNLHTDDDWKGNSGNGNGNNKDNPGSGNNGNNSGNGTGSKTKAASGETAASVEETTETEPGFWENIVSFFTGDKEEKTEAPVATSSNAFARKNDKPNGNNGNGNGNKPEKPDKPNKPNDNTSTGGTNDNNGNANGNTNNTGGSQNQSGILFPIDGEVSELEGELIDMIKTTGKQKNYELVEYVNDVNREHTEVLMELNINGIMDTAYSYGDQRLTNERFTEWTGYYTYDPRGSVTGVTDDKGMIWQSYRYDSFGSITFGQPQYNNVYSYNAESYNPNVDAQYLRARYYSPTTADFISEDSYLGKLTDPLSLNRYNYVNSSPLNYVDPSGHVADYLTGGNSQSSNTVPYAAFEQQKNSFFKDLQSELESDSANMKLGGSNLKISIKKAEHAQETDFCENLKEIGSFLLGMMVGDSAYMKNLGVSLVDWITGGKVSQAMNALTGYYEGQYVDRYLDGEMYYEGKALVDLLYYWQTLPAAEFVDFLSEIGERAGETIGISLGTGLILGEMAGASGGGTLITIEGATVTTGTAITGVAATTVSIVIGGVIITLIAADTNSASQDRYDENKDKADSYKGDSKPLDDVNYDSKQVGKKWGEHMKDYPGMKDYNDYKNYADDIFDSPDKIIHDSANGEYYYTKGDDLLRIKENGDFVSLYPGAASGRVLDAISNGGTVWP